MPKLPGAGSTEARLPMSVVNDHFEAIPELKEGKVDFQAPIEVSEYQQEIVSRVMQTYQKKELRNASISPNSGKKKSGWWQKLLKKPQNKPLENS